MDSYLLHIVVLFGSLIGSFIGSGIKSYIEEKGRRIATGPVKAGPHGTLPPALPAADMRLHKHQEVFRLVAELQLSVSAPEADVPAKVKGLRLWLHANALYLSPRARRSVLGLVKLALERAAAGALRDDDRHGLQVACRQVRAAIADIVDHELETAAGARHARKSREGARVR